MHLGGEWVFFCYELEIGVAKAHCDVSHKTTSYYRARYLK